MKKLVLPTIILVFFLAGCSVLRSSAPEGGVDSGGAGSCRISEPLRLTPPEDAAVDGEPGPGFYYVNADQSIWASAWWFEPEVGPLRAGGDGVKVGWFRPAGETLAISGRRLDGTAPPLESHVPCCYPTRFQASGLAFPAEGCWEVTAWAADKVLTFVVQVEP